MKNEQKKNEKEMPRPGAVLALWALAAFFFVPGGVSSAGDKVPEIEENQITFYKDIFDQNVYSEGVNPLDLSRWSRKIFRKKVPSADVNVFDEVPDSDFFTNRHARRRLSAAELEKGYRETGGPDAGKPLTVVAVEQNGLHYGFVVEDAKKDQYILRFDRSGNLELNTAAEVAASRFYYAIGYNVPQYTTFFFRADQINIGDDAITCDNTGFVKKLTRETFDQYISSIPQAPDGSYRTSASKIPPGKEAGGFTFLSRRKNDPQDPVNHRDRREIRALGIFAAWLNDYGMRESNTLDMQVTENGRTFFKHYLTDFTSTFGAFLDGAKPAVFGHEYLADYGEAFKAFLSLGFLEKPWQKKWREAGEAPHPSPAVGYFSNQYFDPAKYKVQLPYETFRMVTRADGFWAAKTLMKFTDEDVRAMVKASHYSAAGDADFIVKTLAERRDLIAKYWFSRSAPLDGFEFTNGTLSFEDLAVEYGFEKKDGTVYSVVVLAEGGKEKELAKFQTRETKIAIDPSWFKNGGKTGISIRVLRSSSSQKSPCVRILLSPDAVRGIRHED